ncbi:MAG: HEPN domain-containing protein [Chloroflexi bacterium]|nr:HEPN domain-containing protein [Chloroflexota bacterium]
MSKKQKTELTIDWLAQNLIALVGIFRGGGPANDFKWWNSNSPNTIFDSYPGYQKGRTIFDVVVQGLLKLNPDMLSKHEVERNLTYEFLERQAINPEQLSKQELMNQARNHLNKLVEFEARQTIDFPIMNLWLEGEPAKLGMVTFIATTKDDIEQWKKDYMALSLNITDIHVFARVNAPGDRLKAFFYARTQIDLALDILRILCFPFSHHGDTCKIGAIGDITTSTSTPMRINQRRFTTKLGTGTAQLDLRRDILPRLEQSHYELINKLILKTEGSISNMENKLLDAIHWLAESTKQDTYRARFAKISFALETLIGGEPKDEELKVRGITAMLAERAAFIAGQNLEDRIDVDKDIRKYYGMRSDIVHGGEKDVLLSDINDFGILVRRLAFALLEKLDKMGSNLSTVEELEMWVKTQRYALPEENQE